MSSILNSFLEMIETPSETQTVRTLPTIRAPPVIGATYTTTPGNAVQVSGATVVPTAVTTVPATSTGTVVTSYPSYTEGELRPRIIPTVGSITTKEAVETPVRYQVPASMPVVTKVATTDVVTSNAVFDALDKNHDGVLTRDELKGAAVVERVVEPVRIVEAAPVTYVSRAPVVAPAPVVEIAPVITEVEVPFAQRATVDGKQVVTYEEMQLRLASIQTAITQVVEATNTISNACEDRFIKLEKECATRQLAMEAMAKELQARQQRDDLWKSEHASVLSDIAALRNETADLRAKYANELRSQTTFGDALEGLNRKVTQLEGNTGTMKKDLEAFHRGLQADIASSMDTLRREMERCKDQRVWAEFEAMRGQCETFDADIQALRRRPQVDDMVKVDIENLQALTQDLQRKMNDLKRDVVYDKTAAEAAATELRNDLNSFAPRVDMVQKEMTRQLDVWTTAVDERRKEFDILQADYQRRLTKNDKEIAELFASLPPIRADAKRMVDELQAEIVSNNSAINANHQRTEGNLTMIEELRRGLTDLSSSHNQHGIKLQAVDEIAADLVSLKRRLVG